MSARRIPGCGWIWSPRAGRKLSELLLAHQAYRERVAHVVEFESTYWRTLNKLNAAVGLGADDPQVGPTRPVTKEAARP